MIWKLHVLFEFAAFAKFLTFSEKCMQILFILLLVIKRRQRWLHLRDFCILVTLFRSMLREASVALSVHLGMSLCNVFMISMSNIKQFLCLV